MDEFTHVCRAGQKNLLSVVKCQNLETQMWDFSAYGSGGDPNHSDNALDDDTKNPNPEKEDKQNPKLAVKILKEVLDVYAKPANGGSGRICLRLVCLDQSV